MFPARVGMDEIEITLTVSSLTMLSNCAAWSMIDRLATLKNSAKLRGLGGWRYEPRQVRGAGDSAKFTVHTICGNAPKTTCSCLFKRYVALRVRVLARGVE